MFYSNTSAIQREEKSGTRCASPALCYLSEVSSEERERLEEKLPNVDEATEQRMHSVADLIPQGSEEIHVKAQTSTAVEVSAAAPDDNGRGG
jgi:DNA-directed RNA polymerase subunit F